MTVANRIKSELFNADINYQFALDRMKSEYPHGINFCGETVSTKAATVAMSFYKAEAEYNALSTLLTPKHERSTTEELARQYINKYNNAGTSEEAENAEKEYYNLFSIRTN